MNQTTEAQKWHRWHRKPRYNCTANDQEGRQKHEHVKETHTRHKKGPNWTTETEKTTLREDILDGINSRTQGRRKHEWIWRHSNRKTKPTETQKEKKKPQWVMGYWTIWNSLIYDVISKDKKGNQKYLWKSNGQKIQSLTKTTNL